MAQADTASGGGESTRASLRMKVQKFGSYLSGMVMPNIGAFIAWGLITALFIPEGWLPNEQLAQLVEPMIIYLLPLLIGISGGRMVYGVRGAVVGAIATMGVIVGTDIPMFLGAFVMGPLGGYLIMKFDKLLEGKIRQGFEMLVNNFSAGIIGGGLAIIGLLGVAPVVSFLSNALGRGVEFIINLGLLPLVSIFVEPAKILFLNNAINHGIIAPLALDQASEAGKSILFLVETNPGPGLGVLLAYWFVGSGISKASAPGAAIIHFFGGIHEIYFPYVLMKPALILAVICGGASGLFVESIFQVGLVSTPAPGSIFAILALTPPGNFIGVILGVATATAVSFLVASPIIRRSSDSEGEDEDETLKKATEKTQDMKGKKSQATDDLTENGSDGSKEKTGVGAVPSAEQVRAIVFACDAGMGSSAMGASLLRKKVKEADLDIDVTNASIGDLKGDADIIITHKDLTERAKEKSPDAVHVSVDNFLNSPKYDEVIEQLKNGGAGSEPADEAEEPEGDESFDYSEVDKVIFACDAGMGSSAMGASLLRKKAKDAGLSDLEVTNLAINDLPNDADVVITHKDLTERAKAKVPGAHHISVENFMNSPKYDELVDEIASARV